MIFKHLTTGGVYSILAIGLEEATLTPVIVYQDAHTAQVWTRPAKEFFDGRFAPLPRSSHKENLN